MLDIAGMFVAFALQLYRSLFPRIEINYSIMSAYCQNSAVRGKFDVAYFFFRDLAAIFGLEI